MLSNEIFTDRTPFSRKAAKYWSWIGLSAVVVAVWWFNTSHLQIMLAWNGFSPEFVASQFFHPEWYKGDFPSGGAELLRAAPMAVYLFAGWFEVPTVLTMKVFVAAEILLMAGVVYWFVRSIFPNSTDMGAMTAAVLAIAGTYRFGNLARWGTPFYGWVYTFADAAIVVGTGCLIKRRYWPAAISFAVAYVCHPTLGVYGAVFALAALSAMWRTLSIGELALPVLAYVGIVGCWTAYLAMANIGGGGIPGEVYVAFTRIWSDHLYPVDLGVLWTNHTERLLPFIAAILLLEVYLPDQDGHFSGWRSAIASGCAAALIMTFAGVIISAQTTAPLLIKLALHRASCIVLLVSLLIAVPGLWWDATNGRLVRSIFATLTLISCFVCSTGVPIAFAVGLAIKTVIDDLHTRGTTSRATSLIVTGSILLALLVVFAIAGVARWWDTEYSGLTHIPLYRLLIIAVLVWFVRAAHQFPLAKNAVLWGAIVFLGVLWARAERPFAGRPEMLATAGDYFAAQVWASKNTPEGSLFMPDPTHFYGWRDYSHRPSFGTIKEWLYTGWLYNSRKDVLETGLERLSALGVDGRSFVSLPGPPGVLQQTLLARVSERYNSMSCKDMWLLTKRFGIRYFVFQKQPKAYQLAGCSAVYRNNHYLVVSALP